MSTPSAFLFLAVLLCFLALAQHLLYIRKRLGALSRLEIKLDLLLDHAEIKYDPYQHLPQEVAASLQRGEGKIQVIKRYREATGVGLKEAKDVIDQVMRRTGDSE